MDEYSEVVRYMLAQDVKLEQEIVSLDLMKRSAGFSFIPFHRK